MVSRWIFCFREISERELTSEEWKALRRLYVITRWKTVACAILAVLLIIPLVAGISIVTDRPIVGWPILVASIVLSIRMFVKMGEFDKHALAFRRGARLGKTRKWIREVAPVAVRRAYDVGRRLPTDVSDDDESTRAEWDSYWQIEERFDRNLENAAGRPVDQFETCDADGVILIIQGKYARRLIEASIIEIKGLQQNE